MIQLPVTQIIRHAALMSATKLGIRLLQGNRELIDSMAGGSAKVLTQVLKLIDNHDLYGSVAYPKRHTQKDISDIYRLCLATHGVFTNVALQEPFGLTVIEVCVAHLYPSSQRQT